jgi:hypothetical protein
VKIFIYVKENNSSIDCMKRKKRREKEEYDRFIYDPIMASRLEFTPSSTLISSDNEFI